VDEFVDLIVPIKHVGHPYSVDEIIQRQDKPAQKQRNADSLMTHDYTMRIKSFQKAEAYGSVNYPRNISSVPNAMNLRYSCYTHAFKDSVLKKQSWFAFGRTPAEIAVCVTELASKNEALLQTDYSKFDGGFTFFIRKRLEAAVQKAYFAPEHLSELNGLLESELAAPARTRTGLSYEVGATRLSGSPNTADMNSLTNAFLMFAARRAMGMGPTQAFERIGLVGGDDSITGGDLTDDMMISVAKRFGFKVTIEARSSRNEKAHFLGRIFVNPWCTTASVQDPLRTLLKLHQTVSQEKLPAAGIAKASGYLVTDSLTPVVGHWCRAYLRAAKASARSAEELHGHADVNWWVRHGTNNSWPQEESDQLYTIVADSLMTTVDGVMSYCQALDNHTGGVDTLPSLRVDAQLEVKLLAVAGDRILEPEAGPIDPKQNKTDPTSKDEHQRPAPEGSGSCSPGPEPVGGNDGKQPPRAGGKGAKPGKRSRAGKPADRRPPGDSKPPGQAKLKVDHARKPRRGHNKPKRGDRDAGAGGGGESKGANDPSPQLRPPGAADERPAKPSELNDQKQAGLKPLPPKPVKKVAKKKKQPSPPIQQPTLG